MSVSRISCHILIKHHIFSRIKCTLKVAVTIETRLLIYDVLQFSHIVRTSYLCSAQKTYGIYLIIDLKLDAASNIFVYRTLIIFIDKTSNLKLKELVNVKEINE